MVGSTKPVLSSCFALPQEELVSSQQASGLREVMTSPASGDTQRPACPDSVTPEPLPSRLTWVGAWARERAGHGHPVAAWGSPLPTPLPPGPSPPRAGGRWAEGNAQLPGWHQGSTVAISAPSGLPRFLPPCRTWSQHPQGEAPWCSSPGPRRELTGGCRHSLPSSSDAFQGA